jgi:hypothetical protein
MKWIAAVLGIISVFYFLYCEFKARYFLTISGKEKVSTFFLGGFFLDKSYFTPEGWKYRVRGVIILWVGTLLLFAVIAFSN